MLLITRWMMFGSLICMGRSGPVYITVYNYYVCVDHFIQVLLFKFRAHVPNDNDAVILFIMFQISPYL